MLKSTSICDSLCAWVLITSCFYKKSIKLLTFWCCFKYQRKSIGFDDLYAFYVHLLHWLKCFFWVVDHSHKANTCIDVEVGLASGVKAVFFVAFYLPCSCELRDVWSNESCFEVRSYCSIDRRHVGVICTVWGYYHFMIVPKFPFDFRTDQVVPNFELLNIYGAGLWLLSGLGAYVVQRFSLSLEDDDPSRRILVIGILIQELSLVLLINRQNILPWGFDFHQQVCWLIPLCLGVDGSMQESRVELADYNFSEEYLEILPGHVERAIVRVSIVVVLVS